MEPLINSIVKTCVIALLTYLPLHTFAASDRLDYDLDNDGLIEINDWDDVIAINGNADGKGLYGSSLGCPLSGCNGFELTTDLDFDANGDGKLDAMDMFFNDGQGWSPLTTYDTSSSRFSAIFEGNGHVIYNLMINRPYDDNQGFFGLAFGATIRNLGFSGKLMSIRGRNYVGALAGSASQNTKISSCFSTGAIFATGSVAGGLVGQLSSSSRLESSFTSGSVEAPEIVGGIVGSAVISKMSALFTTAVLTGDDYVGGVVGYGSDSKLTYAFATGRIINTTEQSGGLVGAFSSLVTTSYSYWASDLMKTSESPWGGIPVTIKQLQCPTNADNTTCATGKILYEGWSALKNSQGDSFWSFGNSSQLPGAVLNGVTYRDSDGDGVLDVEDSFPNNYDISDDSDGDGIPNAWSLGCDSDCQIANGTILDQLPNNIAASVDMDRDGLPESWNPQCNSVCQANSGLILDASPLDADNDGVLDVSDTDDNNDGIIDADGNSNGLIDINNLQQLNAIRNNLAGTGRQMAAEGATDSSGCPPRLINGILQKICLGYELLSDLDFDTNGDGKLDAQDTYWNDGLGWQGVGTITQPFSATFEGNKRLIRNLMINRWNTSHQGFFGALRGATIRNLGFSGELMSVTGASITGALAAIATESKISGCSSVGTVNGQSYVGGLVGLMSGGTITASFTGGVVNGSKRYVGGVVGQTKPGTLEALFSSAIVTGDSGIGGIIGYAIGSHLSASLSTAYPTGNTNVGELVGVSYRTTTFTPNYWLAQTQSPPEINQQGIGLTLTQLQCPTTADNTNCALGQTLYQDWGLHSHWHFGGTNQLPGLVINGVTNRDNDGDGTFNADDLWPDSFAISKDTDKDGAVDSFHPRCDNTCQADTGLILDHFPGNSAASIDEDADDKPDAWNSSCDTTCQKSSGLVLDAQIDKADADSNGLIDISTWAQFDAIRNNPEGTGRQMNARDTIDSSGCPIQLIDGVSEARCNGYELKTDLDFDTNADGELDSKDIYWNNGTGWVPMFFSATFDGNGHAIRNLMIDRFNYAEDGYNQGLFSNLENATVRDLILTGPLMDIKGFENVGSLAGSAIKTSITGFVSTGTITSMYGPTGGLVGSLYDSSITNSLALGKALTAFSTTPNDMGTKYTGGIAGYASSSNVKAVFSSNTVNGYTYVSGIIGGPDNTTITGAYAIRVVNNAAAPDAAILPALKCATATDNCANSQTPYQGWDKLKDSEGNLYWEFGDSLQLPGLVLNRVIYRIDDSGQLTTAQINVSSSSSSSSEISSSSSSSSANSSGSVESASSMSSSSSNAISSSSSLSSAESSGSVESASSMSRSSSSSSPTTNQQGNSGAKKGGGSLDFLLLMILSGLVAGCLGLRREAQH